MVSPMGVDVTARFGFPTFSEGAMRLLFICLAWLLVAGPVSGQLSASTGYALSALLGAGTVNSKLGVVVGAGASMEARWAVLRLLFDVHLRGPEDSDYSRTVTTDGWKCLEKGTNLIVQDALCPLSRAMVGVSADFSFKVPASPGAVYVGGGFRGGEGSTPYGTLGYGYDPRAKNWYLLLRGVAGADLLQLQAIASISVGIGRR